MSELNWIKSITSRTFYLKTVFCSIKNWVGWPPYFFAKTASSSDPIRRQKENLNIWNGCQIMGVKFINYTNIWEKSSPTVTFWMKSSTSNDRYLWPQPMIFCKSYHIEDLSKNAENHKKVFFQGLFTNFSPGKVVKPNWLSFGFCIWICAQIFAICIASSSSLSYFERLVVKVGKKLLRTLSEFSIR